MGFIEFGLVLVSFIAFVVVGIGNLLEDLQEYKYSYTCPPIPVEVIWEEDPPIPVLVEWVDEELIGSSAEVLVYPMAEIKRSDTEELLAAGFNLNPVPMAWIPPAPEKDKISPVLQKLMDWYARPAPDLVPQPLSPEVYAATRGMHINADLVIAKAESTTPW